MADDEDVAALVIDNGSGMCKGESGEFEFALLLLQFDFVELYAMESRIR
jgi:hypothetical protein